MDVAGVHGYPLLSVSVWTSKLGWKRLGPWPVARFQSKSCIAKYPCTGWVPVYLPPVSVELRRGHPVPHLSHFRALGLITGGLLEFLIPLAGVAKAMALGLKALGKQVRWGGACLGSRCWSLRVLCMGI